MPLSSVRFLPREVPLPVIRVASMFAVKQEEKAPETADESGVTDAVVEKVNGSKVKKQVSQHRRKKDDVCLQEREDVPMDVNNGEPGCQYYEQLCYNNLWLKVGDCVYIASHGLVRHRVGR